MGLENGVSWGLQVVEEVCPPGGQCKYKKTWTRVMDRGSDSSKARIFVSSCSFSSSPKLSWDLSFPSASLSCLSMLGNQMIFS